MDLCSPDGNKSCFACCPPIRPPDYEHIVYRSSMERILRENTRSFGHQEGRVVPIVGFSCWALGYLDKKFGRIGCLLHPSQNEGRDLRYLVDYGGKCARESCEEAKVFESLGPVEKGFWLGLAEGLDSFSYSSRRGNPLFRLLGWGTGVLGRIARIERGRPFSRDTFLRIYPFFRTPFRSKAYAYLLEGIVCHQGVGFLKFPSSRERFENFCAVLTRRLRGVPMDPLECIPTHSLALNPRFLDFLRLAVGIRKVAETTALEMKAMVDGALREFKRDGNGIRNY